MMPAQHIAFSIPLSEPLPSEYYLRLVSQVWVFFFFSFSLLSIHLSVNQRVATRKHTFESYCFELTGLAWSRELVYVGFQKSYSSKSAQNLHGTARLDSPADLRTQRAEIRGAVYTEAHTFQPNSGAFWRMREL